MLNMITAAQMRSADKYTIENKPIRSIDLMESASFAFVNEFHQHYPDTHLPVIVFCGTGNNGGDGLAIARLLNTKGYTVSVQIVRLGTSESEDFQLNLSRLGEGNIPFHYLDSVHDIKLQQPAIIIDAILGSGLNKPVEGLVQSILEQLNSSGNMIVSVDVPSGLASDGVINPSWTCISANSVISFQRPRLSFYFPESAEALQQFKFVDIGLDEPYLESLPSKWKLVEKKDIADILKPRKRFSHKGTYGHALIVAGDTGTMGAALLSAEACVYAGAGLTTACIPASGLQALNTRSPEVMALLRDEQLIHGSFNRYSAIAFGPGTGLQEVTVQLFERIIHVKDMPMVFDADALTMLAQRPDLMTKIPSGTILTPHMKEFDRMFGEHSSWYARIETARKVTAELKIIIVLKNQYTFIVLPDGDVLINPTGNPGMATGGMGDVLTGIIASLLAQGYSPVQAAMMACYIHGDAGDELKEKGMWVIPPTNLLVRLPYILESFT